MKLKNLSLAFITVLLFASCSKSPTEVTESFASSMNNNKFEDAKKVCTPEMQMILDNMMKAGSVNPNSTPGKMTITKEDTKGDISTVYFTSSDSKNASIKQSARLIKSDGNWLVSKLTIE